MTAPQAAQVTANNSFLLLITNNDTLSRSVPIFFKYTQTLRAYMAEAKTADAASKESTTGMTLDKVQIKTSIYEQTVILTTIVSAFADDSNNSTLSERVKNFPSVFKKTRQNDLSALCKDILDKVRPFLPELKDYNITAEMLQEIQDLIDLYDDKVPETRTKVKEKSAILIDRNIVFDLMTDLMTNKILKVAVAFKKDNLTFYNKLVAAAGIDGNALTQIVIVLKNETGTRDLQAMKARSLDSKTHLTPNAKGEIAFTFAKGGLKNIEVPIEGGEPIKLSNIKALKGKTKRIIVTV